LKASIYNLIIPTDNSGEFILYNTLKCSAFVIDEEVKNILENSKFLDGNSLEDNCFQTFKKEGIIIDDNIDERKIVKVLREDSKFHKSYMKFVVLTTYACNLACPYCFEGKGDILHKSMSPDSTKRFIKFVKNMAEEYNRKIIDVTLFGGEPLLNLDACFEILDSLYNWCKEKNIKFKPGIITNGTLLNQEIIDKFVKYGMYFIQITLDGPKDVNDQRRIHKNGKGTYDEIIKNLQMVKKSGIPIQLLVNVDKSNFDRIEELLDDLIKKDLGEILIPIEPVYSVTEACAGYTPLCLRDVEIEKIIPKLWRMADKKGFQLPLAPNKFPLWCGTEFRFSYVVDSFCDIYKCVSFLGKKEHCVGSINEDGKITEIKYPYYDLMARDPLNMETCRDCKLLPMCGGGCPALAYKNYGTYHRESCLRIKGLEDRIKLYLETQFPDKFKN